MAEFEREPIQELAVAGLQRAQAQGQAPREIARGGVTFLGHRAACSEVGRVEDDRRQAESHCRDSVPRDGVASIARAGHEG